MRNGFAPTPYGNFHTFFFEPFPKWEFKEDTASLHFQQVLSFPMSKLRNPSQCIQTLLAGDAAYRPSICCEEIEKVPG